MMIGNMIRYPITKYSMAAVLMTVVLSNLFVAEAFQIQPLQRHNYDSTAPPLFRPNKLSMQPSRRDVLVTIATASSILVTQPVQAKDDSMNYQAVWFDPKHPNGYRVLFGDDQQATLLSRDEPSDDERSYPVIVVKEEGKDTKLLFDFGESTTMEGVFTRNREKIRIISFISNGKNNDFWINKKFEGPIGVYKDSTNSKRVIIIRQIKGTDCVVEFIDDGGKNGAKTAFSAKAGSTFTFDFPDRGEVTALFNLFRRTLTFEDGTVWTKY